MQCHHQATQATNLLVLRHRTWAHQRLLQLQNLHCLATQVECHPLVEVECQATQVECHPLVEVECHPQVECNPLVEVECHTQVECHSLVEVECHPQVQCHPCQKDQVEFHTRHTCQRLDMESQQVELQP